MKLARLMLLPCVLCAVAMGLALLMAVSAGVSGTGLLWDYIRVGVVFTLISFLFWLLIPPIRGPNYRRLSPFQAASSFFREKWLFALLPLLIFPVFMTGFTVAKTCFPFFTGYHWDGFWTDADHLLFGRDPWRITHMLLGAQGSHYLSVVYTLVWGMALAFGLPLYACSATPQEAVRAYTAMMATWLTAGVFGAILFSSVGPVFADLADPTLVERFAPLHESLGRLLPADNPIISSQQYLRDAFGRAEVIRAGGVSAMPSMHLGVCTMLVILSGKKLWRFPAMMLWLAIWIGSVHFGYHYALDGIAGSAIAWLCWKATAPRPLSARADYPAVAIAA